ncbi:DDE-type integrase/transposase/recombinase [Candidatus Accumulibacter sp. ACC003]|uniref:DDE-type integrase/transposase/recombinase n=1 Tax=Candidatus Accumulibacter sp. ACC003 TaxID=2823334 RepID=UPI0025BBCDEA|nr:DDE-type integrase/transposase/recombinase [Candidatus Accumulibacter sp. ACC003]
MNPIDPKALFRLSVLGPLISRERLERGELQQLLRELASREYAIPGSRRRYLSEKTIQAWYYAWRLHQLDGLTPKPRADRGQSKLPAATQAAILAAKRDNPRRSLCQIRQLLEATGTVARGRLARSTIHRLLQQHGLSRITGSASLPEEKRSFVAATAGAIWYGDVMHGPRVPIDGKLAKSYLVSSFDDASRLLTHSAFCPGETALDIEGVLKQAVLKRGIPLKLVVDNGAAYRAETLQGICARLGIHLIHCRPYAPEGKGKLERWHRRCRDQFLSELDERHIASLDDLNARLWAWLEQVYHRSPHAGLAGMTPLARYQQDLSRIRPLGPLAASLDALFQHRVTRLVRKDGTVSYQGQRFEVPFELSGKTVSLVVDPHTETVIGVEDEQGESIGAATPLDALANATRQRRQSDPADASPPQKGASGPNLIEQIYQQYYDPEGE